MTRLLNDVLLVNKVTVGTIEVYRIPILLQSFCQTMIEQIRIATEASHQFIFSFVGSPEPILIDERML